MIRRAWNVTCPEGPLMDDFANSLAHRITQDEIGPSADYTTAILVDDFVEQCDKIFAQHNPATSEEVERLAAEINTDSLYDLVQN